MTENASQATFNPFAAWLRLLGTLGNPETKQGKVFKNTESKATKLFGKLASNGFYLNLAGRSMELMFLTRSQFNTNVEMLLKLWRMPTTSDVDDLREQIYELHGEVEAIGAQLEFLVDQLQNLNARSQVSADANVLSLPRARKSGSDKANGSEKQQEGGA